MSVKREFELIENKGMRDECISRIDVLDRVKDLILLSGTKAATTQQVADYYEVGKEAVNSVIKRHEDELLEDGYRTLSGSEVKELLVKSSLNFTNHRGYFISDGQRFANRSNAIFTKRAILRVGMLLARSEIAKEVRTFLLNVHHDTQEQAPEIIENIVNEIDEERALMMERVEAEMAGDYDKVCVINAKIFALKNKRIQELEDENDFIKNHSLTITESRDVINRIVRTIASVDRIPFATAWSGLYSKLNYKLGINVKARKKAKGQKTILDTLSEAETFELEQIVRCLAAEKGLDVDGLLKIA